MVAAEYMLCACGQDVMRLMLEAGADVPLVDAEGSIALHFAAPWGRLDLFDMLCKHDFYQPPC